MKAWAKKIQQSVPRDLGAALVGQSPTDLATLHELADKRKNLLATWEDLKANEFNRLEKAAKKKRLFMPLFADEIIRTMSTFQIVTDRSRCSNSIEETSYDN